MAADTGRFRAPNAAAALSTPYDLAAGSRHLETPIGRLYVHGFLQTLRPKAFEVAARFPEAAALLDIERCRTFWDFDDAATGPLHGFAGAEDYYGRSSSIHFLGRIETPTFCLSAEDDPFLPSSVLSRARQAAAPAVSFVTTPRGGHIGFVSGAGARYWAEERTLDWLGSVEADGR